MLSCNAELDTINLLKHILCMCFKLSMHHMTNFPNWLLLLFIESLACPMMSL